MVSSDIDVAYYAEGKIEARAAGTVTFTLTYYTGDDAIEFELPVEVKETGVATRVEVEDQKVAINTALTDLDFKVFDQHDLDITSTDKYSVVVKDEGVTDLSAKGTYTIEIQDEDDKVIGTFTVTVVDVEEADFDKFFFEEVDEDDVLDVKKDDRNDSKNLTLKGIKDGVTVTADNLDIVTSGDGLYLESSDNDVFTVAYNAGTVTVTLNSELDKAATAKVVLTNKMGSIEITEAELKLEVVNTTPQIDKLTLGDEDKVVVGDTKEATLIAALEVLLTGEKDKDGKDKFEYNMVEDITFIPGNNIVEVKIIDIYGGKIFRFDVEVIDGTVVRTEEQLKNAVEAGGTVVLANDIKVTNELKIKSKFTLDGNGYKLTKDEGSRVINATKIDGLTIKNVVFDNAGAVYVESFTGKIEITGNTFKNNRGTALILDLVQTKEELTDEEKTRATVIVEDNDFTEAKGRLVADHHGLYVDDIMGENIFGKAVESVEDTTVNRHSPKVIKFKAE